ncbi:XRE family transcriptional regulator [Rhodoferax sp. GW822-FHT02A01]|uniref:helix-turn-helix domain-containing protein n=1 Tax=Rhodoferax sp. GW822-FHT02A01 TaxID=3141537 RepID=UPI00315CED96
MAIQAARLPHPDDPATDDAQPSAFDPEASIGEQLRDLRKARNLTLKEVSQAAGISVGYLSQLERNHSRLPIGVLKKISDVLGVHMNWFFQQSNDGVAAERDIVVRANNRRRMSFTGLGITEELLSPNLSGPLELLISSIAPGADSEDYSHDGAEAGLVLAGTLELWVSGRHFTLNAGDSFSFKSTEVHRCANHGKDTTQVLWVITPPHY